MVVCGTLQICKAERQSGAYVKFIPDKNEFFSHEYVTGDLWLYTENPDVLYIKEVKAPTLKNNRKFDYFTKITKHLQPHVETIEGRQIYVIPISSYILMVDEAGKYELKDGIYEIGVNVPSGNIDPFWGRGRYYETIAMNVEMKPLSLKVMKLPAVKDSELFSGAVGEFKISTTLPPGDIFINEEASVIVTITGKGIVPDDILPEYQDAFGTGNKLKSVSDNGGIFIEGNDILSRKELECTFVPDDLNNCKVGKIRFGFFNPSTRKYEVVESEPITIDVKSSAIKIKPVYI